MKAGDCKLFMKVWWKQPSLLFCGYRLHSAEVVFMFKRTVRIIANLGGDTHVFLSVPYSQIIKAEEGAALWRMPTADCAPAQSGDWTTVQSDNP